MKFAHRRLSLILSNLALLFLLLVAHELIHVAAAILLSADLKGVRIFWVTIGSINIRYNPITSLPCLGQVAYCDTELWQFIIICLAPIILPPVFVWTTGRKIFLIGFFLSILDCFDVLRSCGFV